MNNSSMPTVLESGLTQKMASSKEGACMVFQNDTNRVKEVIVDIGDSDNLQMVRGDTSSKKTIRIQPKSRANVIMKAIDKHAGHNLQFATEVKSLSQTPAKFVKDQYSALVERVWPVFNKEGANELTYERAEQLLNALVTRGCKGERKVKMALIDVDNNGTISKAELAQFLREHHDD